MPTKELFSPYKNGVLKDFKFGGGANTIFAFEDPDKPGVGYQSINAGGGNDTVTGSPNDDTIIGGTGSDDIAGGLGNDTIYGGKMNGTDAPKGHNAVLINNLTGDDESVLFVGGTYTGGNDTIFGGDGGTNNIYGDVRNAFQFSSVNTSFTGGDDMLTGGDGTAGSMAINNIFGDAVSLFFTANDPLAPDGDSFTGGGDTLTGGDFAANILLGDVQSISRNGDFIGGNDTLIGGANGSNTMIGDISSGGTGNTVTGGDDRLVSGENSNDFMTGDFGSGVTATTLTGGADTFVFATDNGLDTITDFETGVDTINLFGTGMSLVSINSVGGLVIDANDDHVTTDGTDLVIDLGAAADGPAGVNLLTIEDVTQLATTDFDFAMLV